MSKKKDACDCGSPECHYVEKAPSLKQLQDFESELTTLTRKRFGVDQDHDDWVELRVRSFMYHHSFFPFPIKKRHLDTVQECDEEIEDWVVVIGVAAERIGTAQELRRMNKEKDNG